MALSMPCWSNHSFHWSVHDAFIRDCSAKVCIVQKLLVWGSLYKTGVKVCCWVRGSFPSSRVWVCVRQCYLLLTNRLIANYFFISFQWTFAVGYWLSFKKRLAEIVFNCWCYMESEIFSFILTIHNHYTFCLEFSNISADVRLLLLSPHAK